jgi:HSP20 family molecular chaperone IbpA
VFSHIFGRLARRAVRPFPQLPGAPNPICNLANPIQARQSNCLNCGTPIARMILGCFSWKRSCKRSLSPDQRGRSKGVRKWATTALEKEDRLQRREPLDIFDEMQDEFRRFWNEPWSFLARRPLGRLLKVPATWFPRVDMYEKKDQLFVKVDLPGMKKEDIQVSVDKGTSSCGVKARRKARSKKKTTTGWSARQASSIA